MANAKKLIFILGQGRSGTTLLNRILSSHPEVGFINDEFNSLCWFWKRQANYDKFGAQKYWRMAVDFSCSFELREKQIMLPKATFLALDNFHDWLIALLECYCPNARYAGIKIVSNLSDNTEMIKSEFADSYCLHIVRDPRDVFLSIMKTPIGTQSPFYFGKSWMHAVSTIGGMRGDVEHYYEITYERLISFPNEELAIVCAWLDIPYLPTMLRFFENAGDVEDAIHQFLKRPIIQGNHHKWLTKLNEKQLKLIYAACGDKMHQLGYLDRPNSCGITILTRISQYIYDKITYFFRLVRAGMIFAHHDKRHNIFGIYNIILIKISSKNKF